MKSADIRKKYLEFYKERGHAVIPAAPIVPPDDPTTLFTSSGMQQMVPYLKGEHHPMGTRLTDSQPSFRADDIEEVGDNRHTCMFEMLGNWSLGDYFKAEQLPWVYEFLTKEVGLDPQKLYVSVFAGDESAPRDDESIKIWQSVFNTDKPAKVGTEGFDPATKIYLYPAKKNWWSRAGEPAKMPVGEVGGPDSEVFYDFGEELHLHENSSWSGEPCHVNCDCGRFLEIGNSVFMQYVKTDSGVQPLPKNNVDFGGGLERLAAASQNTPDIFTTDSFTSILRSIEVNESVVKMSGVFWDAAASRSSPPPKSTLFLGSGCTPLSVFTYCINTELPISRNRPQSQFTWHGSPDQEEFSCKCNSSPKS